MNKSKKRVFMVVIFCICLFEVIGIGFFVRYKELSTGFSRTLNGLPVYESSGVMAYNMSNINEAVGAVEYVFVARINEINRTEYRNSTEVEVNATGTIKQEVADPYTIYNVSVIENIKGDLIIGKNIEIVQNGGLNKDRKSYSFLDGGSLLEEGHYYVILAFVPYPNGELLIHNKYTYERIDISDNSNYAINSFDLAISENDVIDKYREAYANEVVPEMKTIKNYSLYDATLAEEK